MNNYTKRVASSKATIDIPIDCVNVDLSSLYSATLTFQELKCEENVKIEVGYSSTIVIGKLICNGGKIEVSCSSTIHIFDIDCPGNLQIEVSASSTLGIHAGKIKTLSGAIKYSSTGTCAAELESDEVTAKAASTWRRNKETLPEEYFKIYKGVIQKGTSLI